MNTHPDWQALSETWQRQPTPDIDMAAVAAEVRRRGRWLRLLVFGELAMSVLVVAVLGWLLPQPQNGPLEKLLLAAVILVLVAYQAYAMWIHRRQLGDDGLDATALAELEIRRTRTRLRYWRLSSWTAFGLWLMFYLFATWHWRNVEPGPSLRDEAPLLLFFVAWLPAICAYVWWRCRTLRQRLARFAALLAQLRAP